MKVSEKPTQEQMNKLEKLKKYIKSLGKIAVAFSGGVDSTFLLWVAKEVLGNNVIAITSRLNSFPNREFTESQNFCKLNNISWIEFTLDELTIDGFKDNPINRCYLCKRKIFSEIKRIAKENDILEVAEGSNVDDAMDYRPGLKAIEELEIKSPLRIAGMMKEDIRVLSRFFGLPTWDKPSFACLSTRFEYGDEITEEKLAMVDKGEQLLLDLGFSQVRVRVHGKMARIEILPEEFSKLIEENNRKKIYESFREYGFTYVSMDLMGYRTGSMNAMLKG